MRKQLQDYRDAMRKRGIDLSYLGMDDEHMSEYVGPHDRVIAEISGFTGSSGTLLISANEARLWTDGRYHIQAEAELSDSGITLMKQGAPDVPDVHEVIGLSLSEGSVFAFDGKRISAADGERLYAIAAKRGARTVSDADPAGEVWKDRPRKTAEPLWILEDRHAGESAAAKLYDLQNDALSLGADCVLIASLDDIAWLLNLRGADIPCNPVFSAFFLLNRGRRTLYTEEAHLTDEVRGFLSDLNVETVTVPGAVYRDVSSLSGRTVLLEKAKTNYALLKALPETAGTVDAVLPTSLRKALKNRTEIANLRRAQEKDGAAMVRFLKYFEEHIGSGLLTECSLRDTLHAFRAADPEFLEESFETISAYGANAAMCHYTPSDERDVTVEPRGLYLVDSGGQYPEGTTDITRTLACGPVSDVERLSYTLSVIANLRLAAARFPEGVSGLALDGIAREVFWERGLDFDHGTGHGVGFCLNVHEGPYAIRCRAAAGKSGPGFQAGIYISDEPGHYVEGSHGVRTENLLLCIKDGEASEGEKQFLKFETMTLCPLDKKPLDVSLMTARDISLFNEYHRMVFSRLSPLLDEEERRWLFEACRLL